MTRSETLVCCTLVYHPRTVRTSKQFPGNGFVCQRDCFCLFVLLFLVVYEKITAVQSHGLASANVTSLT